MLCGCDPASDHIGEQDSQVFIPLSRVYCKRYGSCDRYVCCLGPLHNVESTHFISEFVGVSVQVTPCFTV